MMTLLEIITSFQLKDCWLCAGTLRNYIWYYLSSEQSSATHHLSDVDVIFFDKNISYEETLVIEEEIKKQYPQYHWEIKNQYYMNSHSPNTDTYLNSRDAVSKFPEKCTAIAARLDHQHELELFIPFGTDDLINYIVSPTTHFVADQERHRVYNERVKKKNWKQFWPNLTMQMIE